MNRQQRQKLLMERKLQEARNRMRLVGTAGLEDAADLTEAKDLRTYRYYSTHPSLIDLLIVMVLGMTF